MVMRKGASIILAKCLLCFSSVFAEGTRVDVSHTACGRSPTFEGCSGRGAVGATSERTRCQHTAARCRG